MGKLFDYLTKPSPSAIFREDVGRDIASMYKEEPNEYHNPDLRKINREIRKIEMHLTFAKRKPNVSQSELDNLNRKLQSKLSEREAILRACEKE